MRGSEKIKMCERNAVACAEVLLTRGRVCARFARQKIVGAEDTFL